MDDFVKLVSDRFNHKVSESRKTSIEKELSTIRAAVAGGRNSPHRERCSSIHKAKGLEADAVLVVAKTATQLRKWLEIDREQRNNDKNDDCRLGYVAFTRAREMLCIACLKSIDDEMRRHLGDLGVSFVAADGK